MSVVTPLLPGGPHCNALADVAETPHRIEILEEPMEFGYRFRYEVEGKAHGGLQAQSSKLKKRGTKTYPTIQVCIGACLPF